ncbi:MAG: hypothetical protein SAJ12_10860 [Jaaginema sp. PMC 1079.18]|nr:hypothetical protein [Jaaginema sp. PMC 1080.18]MEC4851503.1 hypothetical protein [Jaaginema sp. PMC 1079.18]MEC4864731.1 hypothetical protein [Jaaginema sp. PMC 1078.18]
MLERLKESIWIILVALFFLSWGFCEFHYPHLLDSVDLLSHVNTRRKGAFTFAIILLTIKYTWGTVVGALLLGMGALILLFAGIFVFENDNNSPQN